ncbi:hypothetical protein MYA_6022 (plasmid) [Burkholderia sp. KJ006]|nr:hypothetical protein MYA_6022 [Burkholderia sp. KJ006]
MLTASVIEEYIHSCIDEIEGDSCWFSIDKLLDPDKSVFIGIGKAARQR